MCLLCLYHLDEPARRRLLLRCKEPRSLCDTSSLDRLDEPERDEVAPVARRDVRERRLELAERHLGIASESSRWQVTGDNSDDV